MSVERADFDAISEQDLQELVAAQVPEGLRLEYKQEAYGGSDAEKREFLKDISALSNTTGGHLILGMEEAEGLAARVVSAVADNPDAELLRLEQIAQNGLEPRISGIRMKAIPLSAGGVAILVRVPRSWNLPHRVVAQGVNRFYMRHSSGTHQPSVEELRALFTQTTSALDAARRFHAERIASIQAGEGERPLVGGGRLIVHLVPAIAFSRSVAIDVQQAYAQHTAFNPLGTHGLPRYNYHGFLNERGGDENYGYTQIFRNGILETTSAGIVTTHDGRTAIPGLGLEGRIFQRLHSFIVGLRDLGVPPPLIFMLTLEGVAGASYIVRQNIFGEHEPPFPVDIVSAPEGIIEDYGDQVDHHRAVKVSFDALWNAAGYAQAHSFSDEGRWTGSGPSGFV